MFRLKLAKRGGGDVFSTLYVVIPRLNNPASFLLQTTALACPISRYEQLLGKNVMDRHLLVILSQTMALEEA